MKVVIKKRAQKTIQQVADWIAEQYFIDTGIKWLDDFEHHIDGIAKSRVKYPICKDESLARYDY